ncbi:hypothetical protein H696_06113 [Fonticula alba]|uniref:Growth factor receptor domain-containing protein n=1 Tax=Fonticula alba TaxID=691883 RepID=A0A058Z1W6_FONAL|nr:hypothetical protein H696_06113 [Fonticula alba]KCV67472.1 hypothetical protein H696_06113 [Fonticula alba]|eukprot:XP_009498148.1 hypothetical protein H696_06113 [Fonticula alba]
MYTPIGFFAASGACSACPANCTSCTSASQCTGCQSRYFLPSGTGLCQLCHVSCAACTSSTACTACQPGLVFLEADPQVDALCTATCHAGEYAGPGRCAACHSSCALCTGTARACQACAPGHRWDAQAPVGPDAAAPCTPCPDGCTACTASMCLSCREGLFLSPAGSCSATCPSKMYPDAPSRTCQSCDPTCAECRGPAGHQCTSCIAGLEPLPAAGSPHACLSPCPDGEFRPPGSPACQPCHTACAQCNGPTDRDCWRCQDTHLQEGQCVQQCAPKHVPQAGQCMPCHASCGSCSGTRSLDCTGACPDGLLATRQTPTTMLCRDTCPENHTPIGLDCLKCMDNCVRCSRGPDICDQCARNWLLSHGQCVATCRETAFSVGTSCVVCHESCASCFGPGPDQCLTCPARAPLLHEYRCLAGCPAGTYQHAETCMPCSPACATCHGPAAHQCTSCPGAQVLAGDGACIDACPDGQYAHTTDDHGRLCRSCSTHCRQCHGPADHQCTACPGDGLLQAGRCVASCSPGHFACPGPARTCEPCPAGCAACQHHHTPGPAPCEAWCTACQPGRLLSPLTGACGQACPAGEVAPPATAPDAARCRPCAAACATCHGHAARCTACAHATDWLLPETGSCSPGCPSPGYTPSPVDRACLPCPEHCEDCAAGPDTRPCATLPDGALSCPAAGSCLRCEAPYVLLDQAACVPTCPAGFFHHHEAPVPACARCHPDCATCIGPESRDCIVDNAPAARRLYLALGLGLGLGFLLLCLLVAVAPKTPYARPHRRRAAPRSQALEPL